MSFLSHDEAVEFIKHNPSVFDPKRIIDGLNKKVLLLEIMVSKLEDMIEQYEAVTLTNNLGYNVDVANDIIYKIMVEKLEYMRWYISDLRDEIAGLLI